jgi:hypothetical protein
VVPKGNCSWPRLEIVTVKQKLGGLLLGCGVLDRQGRREHERRVEAMPCSGSPAIGRSLEV